MVGTYLPTYLRSMSRALVVIYFNSNYYLGMPHFLKKWANPGLFLYFRFFLVTILIQIEKNVDGVFGIRTWGHRMVGADENTEHWQPPRYATFSMKINITFILWLLKMVSLDGR